MARKKTKRPNRFIYFVFGFIVILISMLFRKIRFIYKMPDGKVRTGKRAKLVLAGFKPPFIIVGNHQSIYDHFYMVRAFYPFRLNFIVARKLFLAGGLSLFVKFAHAIPKSLFQPDVQTIRESFDILLSQNGILALYPDGQIGVNGISKEMPESCGKLVKKMKLPVYGVRTTGAYFCDNSWRKFVKRGIIEVEVSELLTPEQITTLSADEIDKYIAEKIYVDNYAEQERTGYLYKGFNRAAGLENILYQCPECKHELTLKTKKHDVICTHCGAQAEYTESAHLDWKKSKTKYYPHIGAWYNAQRDVEKKRHLENDNFCFEAAVELRVLSEQAVSLTDGSNCTIKKTRAIEKAGTGVLRLCEDGYFYEGEVFGKEEKLRFDPLKIRYIPYTPGSNFQIYSQDVMFAFHPKDPRLCAKIALTIETLYEKKIEEQNNFESA